MTNSTLATASVYQRHNEARMARLRGTNHAGQISHHCQCGNTFDVGWERFHTTAFAQRPLCFDCTTKETP